MSYRKQRPQKVDHCYRNGCGGIINGAAPPFPAPDCLHCGWGKITTHNKYCPSCFHCLTCDRVIKRLRDRKDTIETVAKNRLMAKRVLEYFHNSLWKTSALTNSGFIPLRNFIDRAVEALGVEEEIVKNTLIYLKHFNFLKLIPADKIVLRRSSTIAQYPEVKIKNSSYKYLRFQRLQEVNADLKKNQI